MTKKQTLRKGRILKQLHVHDGRFRPALLSQTIRRICLYSAGALIGQTVLGGAALAAPQGGQVVGGSGTIHQHGNITQIHQNSNSLAIDWQSFDISRKETVNFQQPSSSSAALNRILDQKPSQIFGSITANGKVFLLNPNGIIFGKTASVNVGSLVAGTLDMSAKDFMAGRYDLAALAGKDGIVINRGLIKAATGGSVTLVGGAVVNEGVIVADYGQVNLAAGRKATLDFDGDGLIRFEVSEDVLENAAGLDDAVLNSGTIQAQGGQVLLTASAARDVFTNVVNNTGVIRAGRIDNQGGVVRLVGTGGNTISSGTIDASGQDDVSTGGTVHVLGDNAGLFGDASIDVSGATGGGTVLVGGDFQGKNPEIRNAARTYISGNATINADATESGDGGKVIVWADDVTRYYGNITARGGSNAGDGGFVEVSGKAHLVFRGSVDTTAANGKMGRLLLDPTDLIISDQSDGNGADDGQIGGVDGTIAFADAGATATISAGALEALPNTTNISMQATNSITIQKLTTNKGGTPDELTLLTDGTVEFLTGAGGFTMDTGDTIRITGAGSLRIDAIGSTSGGTGSGSVQVGSVVTNGAGAGVTVSGTDVTVGSITTAGAGSGVSLDGTTSVTVNGAITTADVTTAGAASGGITITASTGTIALNNNLATGNAAVADAAGVTTATSGDISLTAATGINGAGTVTTGNASVDAATDDAADTATSGTITLNVTGAGDVGLSAVNALTTGSATVTTETSANEVATVGNIVVTSADRVNNGTPGTALDVSFGTASGSSSNVVGALSITTDGGAGAAGEILVTSGQALNLGVLNAGTGNIGVSSASTINEAVNDATDNIVTTGAVTLAGATGIGTVSALDLGGVTNLTLDTGQSFNASTSGTLTDLAVTVDPGTTADTYTLVDNDAGAANLTFSLTDNVADLTVTDVSVATGSLNFSLNSSTGNINLAAVNTGGAGNLAVTAVAGNIIDSGVTTVGGTASFTTSATNADINLAQLDVTGAIDVNTTGATGNATLVNATAVNLAASSVGGNLNVTATTGDITDSGAATVGGTASFTTSAANASINLAQLAVTGSIDVNTNGATGNATVVNATAVDLATSNVGGNLAVTATTGGITGSGALTVNGNSTFTAPDAASISLANAGNTFTGPVQFLSAGTLANVTVVNTTALDLQALTLTGNLDATGAGLTQSGALTIGGTTTLAAGAVNDITLTTAGNDFTGSVGITSGNNVTLVDSNDIDLAASNVSGNLGVTAAAGNITSSGALTVGGNSTFTVPDASSIALTDPGNAFTGSVQFLASAGTLANVTVVNSAALDLQALTLTGNLDATGAGLTQSGVLTIGGTTTLAAGAGNDITLNTAGNDFTGSVGITSGNNVTLVDGTALDLAASTVSGNLNVTAGGNITDSGPLTVAGNSSFTAPNAGSIILDDAGNAFTGTVQFLASAGSLANVTVADTTALDLQALALTGNLDVTAAGLTDSGALVINGTTTLAAGAANDIVLDTAGNDFTGSVGITSGNNVTLVDSNAIDLAASTVSGNLNVSSAGAITDSGALAVGGTTTLAAGAGNDITLNTAGNNFNSVAITSGNNVTLVDSNAIDLAASNVSGNLGVTAAAGNITSSGALTVGGNSTFTVPDASSIALTNAGNAFTGSVQFLASAGTLANVTVVNTAALDLQALTLTGNLDATGAGLTQSGALTIGGTTTLAAGAGNDITLNTAGNDFTGSVGITSGNNVTLVDSNALDLAASTVSGNLNVTAGGNITDSGPLTVAGNSSFTAPNAGSIILDDAGNAFTGAVQFLASAGTLANVTVVNTAALDLQALTLTGNLDVTAAGLTDSGALAIGGTTTLAAGAGNNIVLDTAGNDFTGSVGITSGNNVTLVDSNAIDLAASTVSGNLNVSSTGAITDSGALTVGGTTTLAAGAGNNIVLDTAGNDFSGSVGITSGNNVTLVDSSALDLATATVSGNLAVTSAGDITDSGNLAVAGNSVFTAPNASSITLDSAGNTFTGTVQFLASTGTLANVTVANTTALDLQALALTGNLDATGAGLTQSGALTIGGTTTLAAGAGNDITLATAGNDFTGSVAITSGNNVTLVDSGALDLAASTVSGNLAVTSGGDITDSGTLTVAGNSTFTAPNAGSITLDDAGNTFAGPVQFLASAGTLANVTVVNTTALDLQALTLTGNLDATGAGLTDSGALVVGGTTILAAGAGNDIVLDTAGNDFSSVSVTSGNNVTLVDSNAIDLAASTVSGNLDVSSAGAITDSGILAIGGTTTLAAGAGNDITLNTAGNDFTGSVGITSGNNVTLVDSSALDLAASTVSGNLAVTSGGDITDSGNLAVAGNSTFTAPNAASITLDSAGNAFTGTVQFLASAGTLANVTVVNTAALDLQALTLTGNLDATGAGLTDSGALVIGGTTTLAAGAGNDITLNTAGNDFTGSVGITSGDNVTLVDSSALDLAASTVSGNLNVTAGGDITDSGALAVAGSSTFTAPNAGSVTLDDAGNAFTGTVQFLASAGTLANVTVVNTLALDLQALALTGNLDATGAGLTQSGALSIGGSSSFNGGANAITLTNAGNDFTGAVSLNNSGANNAAVTDSNAIDLGVSSVGGNLTVVAGGAITDSGAISATSLTTSSVGGTLLDAGHSVSGFTATNTGSGDITFNNSGSLAAAANNSAGDITITNNGDVLLGLLSAPGNTVNVTAAGGGSDILNNNGNNTNIQSTIANLTAGSRIGVSANDPITLDVLATGDINLVFGVAEAFISNINQTPVTIIGGGTVVDVVGSAIAGAGRAQDAELADVGFVDWSLFSEDLSLFGVVEPGIKLPKDQIEDDLVLKAPEPDVPLLLKTARGWEFLWAFQRTALGEPAVRPETQERTQSF